MGNQTSKSATGSPSSATVSPTVGHHESPQSQARRTPRRKESLQAFSAKPTATATPDLATALPTTTTTTTQDAAPTSQARSRSQTSATSSLKEHRGTKATSEISRNRSTRSAGSTDKAASRSRSPHPLPLPANPIAVDAPQRAPAVAGVAAGEDPALAASPQDVSSEDSAAGYYMARDAMFAHPPRLPLPIEQEEREPGSPIIRPDDSQQPPIPDESVVALQQHSSMLSSTTADDENIGDDLPLDSERQGPKYPTLIEWTQPGEKVFVTGTFADWSSKHKLHKNGPSANPDALSRLLPLPVGTHYIMFLVDGNMVTSKNLPTTVDYTNSLVNYIEVSMPPEPEPALDEDQKATQDPSAPQVTQPIVIPAGPHPGPQTHTRRKQPSRQGSSSDKYPGKEKAEPKPRRVLPPREYTTDIPRLLLDLDEPEESTRFYRTQHCMMTLPQPPSLPSWLNKSILNGTMPMKDDSSVLNKPNHTVLNHLATSSIKQEVLATSATTRYKNKMVTTVMYNPTKDVS